MDSLVKIGLSFLGLLRLILYIEILYATYLRSDLILSYRMKKVYGRG